MPYLTVIHQKLMLFRSNLFMKRNMEFTCDLNFRKLINFLLCAIVFLILFRHFFLSLFFYSINYVARVKVLQSVIKSVGLWNGREKNNTSSIPLEIKRFFFCCPIKNEIFLKIEITLSLLFPISYFTLSSLTYKTTLYKILCRKANISYLLGRREYISKIW